MTTATATRRTATTGRSSGALTGTWTLVRFMLRRDRLRILAWTLGITLVTVASAGSFVQSYPTEADRQVIAATTDTPAMVAMVGVNHAPDAYTYGAMLGHQMLWSTLVVVGLMSVLLFVRHTRLEEATGRAELVRAGVVGRHAGTAAALATVAITNVVLAVLLAIGLASAGIETVDGAGSWLYGATHAAVGLVFVGLAAITVQITEYSRGASGMAIAGIGLAYVLRAMGDVGDGNLSWVSPIGWGQATRVYVDNRWWPLLLATGTAAVFAVVGMALSTRRDVGAGLRPPRRGKPTASEALANPFGFAFRLQRANLIGWSVGLFLLGVSYGSVLGEAEQWLEEIEAMADMLPDIAGVGVLDTFAAMITTVMAIFASAYVVLAAQKLRSEESAGRAEPVLATALSRTRWAVSHLTVALLGGVVVLLAGGLGLGLAGAGAIGDASLVPRLLGAALAYAPALWVTAAVAAGLYGFVSRALPLAWIVVAYSFVVVYLGGPLQFPDWLTNLSPFGHVPQVPAESLALTPLVVLTLIAAALAAAGITAFRNRDLASTA